MTLMTVGNKNRKIILYIYVHYLMFACKTISLGNIFVVGQVLYLVVVVGSTRSTDERIRLKGEVENGISTSDSTLNTFSKRT